MIYRMFCGVSNCCSIAPDDRGRASLSERHALLDDAGCLPFDRCICRPAEEPMRGSWTLVAARPCTGAPTTTSRKQSAFYLRQVLIPRTRSHAGTYVFSMLSEMSKS